MQRKKDLQGLSKSVTLRLELPVNNAERVKLENVFAVLDKLRGLSNYEFSRAIERAFEKWN